MEKLYQTYKDIAAIYIVYVKEAHPSDGSWPVGYAKKMGIKQHTSFTERCAVAEQLVKDKKLTIPFLVDNMENGASLAYQAWPDRVFLIRRDGQLGVAAKRGPWGFRPAVQAAEKWLAEYKKTGKDPALPDPEQEAKADFGELSGDLGEAYQDGDYQKALAVALKMHDLRPEHVGTIYNIACMHCLAGHKEMAYAWLEKAIAAGYRDADHLRSDDDFKAIRKEDRFAALVKRAANGKDPPKDTKKKPRPDLPDEI